MKCPKCGYVRKPSDEAPDWQCPSCQIAYAKFMQKHPVSALSNAAPKPDNASSKVMPESDEDDYAREERLWLAASGQRIVIFSILLNMILRAAERSQAIGGALLHALLIGVAIYALAGVVKICSGLGKNQNQKVLFMVLACFPLINLVALASLSIKATRMLRAAGWRTGLLGAKP